MPKISDHIFNPVVKPVCKVVVKPLVKPVVKPLAVVKPLVKPTYGIKDPIPAAIVVPGSAFPEPPKSRKENNRIAAAKSRAVRKAQAERREMDIAELRRANADLLDQVNALTQTVLAMQQQSLSFPSIDVNPAYEAWVDSLLE
jgi:hypothetical protein